MAARDQRLERVRRADWRFLLPQVRPSRVAVIGAASTELLVALRDTMGSVEVLTAESPFADGFELVVLVGEGPVHEAARRVAPGGSLYWELPRNVRLAQGQLQMRDTGLTEVRAHWHHPSFDACREIVPLDNAHVLRHVLQGGAHGARGELRRAAGRWLCRLGRVESMARDRSLLAVRPGQSIQDEPPCSRLRRSVTENGKAGSLLVKTPRFRASGHVLLFAFAPGQSGPARVAKMQRLNGDPTLDREAACLQALERAGTLGVPRLDARDTFGGVSTLVETVVPGQPLHPDRLRRNPTAHLAAGVEWITTLHERTAQPVVDRDAWWAEAVEAPLQSLRAAFPSGPESDWITRTEQRVQPLREGGLPTVFEHGDIGAPNLLLDDDGTFGVVDWELGQPRGLIAADLFFFLGFAAVARERARTAPEFASAFRKAFFGPSAWASSWIRSYGDRLGIASSVWPPLFVLSAARVVAHAIERVREGEASLIDGGERLEWLRSERSYVLWRETVENWDNLGWTGPGEAA